MEAKHRSFGVLCSDPFDQHRDHVLRRDEAPAAELHGDLLKRLSQTLNLVPTLLNEVRKEKLRFEGREESEGTAVRVRALTTAAPRRGGGQKKRLQQA